VAGNRAGLVYNEWPRMGGGLVPPDLASPHLAHAPWRNLFEVGLTGPPAVRVFFLADFSTIFSRFSSISPCFFYDFHAIFQCFLFDGWSIFGTV
jgi:hypothetical protein